MTAGSVSFPEYMMRGQSYLLHGTQFYANVDTRSDVNGGMVEQVDNMQFANPFVTYGTALGMSGATATKPCKITTSSSHGLSDGDIVVIDQVGGMVQLNGSIGVVAVVDADEFHLTGVDSTDYTGYDSGGLVIPLEIKSVNDPSTDLTAMDTAATAFDTLVDALLPKT
ncbi:unnamed protein product, partial [marine sediment metagenome]